MRSAEGERDGETVQWGSRLGAAREEWRDMQRQWGVAGSSCGSISSSSSTPGLRLELQQLPASPLPLAQSRGGFSPCKMEAGNPHLLIK